MRGNLFSIGITACRTHRLGMFPLIFASLANKAHVTRLRILGMRIGEGTVIKGPFRYRYPHHIFVGRRVTIGTLGFLVAGPNSKIHIGHDCLIAPNVHINTTAHRYSDLKVPIRLQGGAEKDVTVGNDVWIGTGAIVLRGGRGWLWCNRRCWCGSYYECRSLFRCGGEPCEVCQEQKHSDMKAQFFVQQPALPQGIPGAIGVII